MPSFLKALLALSIMMSPTWLRAAEPTTTSETAFERLSSLIGNWQGTLADGRHHSVSYRLTAGGSVLVETWTLGAGRESMTLYAMDGDSLLATHYCPQGNQPRLRLIEGAEADKYSFAFLDGANLQVKDKWHQHAFWIRLDGPNSFTRSETYVENGSSAVDAAKTDPGEAVTFTRVVAEGAAR